MSGTQSIAAGSVFVLTALAAGCGTPVPQPPVDAAPGAFADVDGTSLVQNWIEAVGGMENYTRLHSARFTLTTEMWDASSGRLRRTRPRYVWIRRTAEGQHARVERWEGNDFIAHGWNPAGQWASMNGTALSEGDKDYDEADYVGGDVNYWIGIPFKLLDPGVNLTSEGLNSEDQHVVRVNFGDDVGDHRDVWRYYFEEGQAWPARVEYVEAGRTSVNRTWWKDIRVTDGYYYAGRRVYFDEQERVTKVILMSDLVVNPELDLALFQGP